MFLLCICLAINITRTQKVLMLKNKYLTDTGTGINLFILTVLWLQVYYDFNPIFMFAEPLMLISAVFLFFVACIAYVHVDLSIGKSS